MLTDKAKIYRIENGIWGLTYAERYGFGAIRIVTKHFNSVADAMDYVYSEFPA